MNKSIALLVSVLLMFQVCQLTGFFFDLVPTKQIKHPIKQTVLRNPYVADGQKKYHINQKRPFDVLNTVKSLKQDIIKTVLQQGSLSVDLNRKNSSAASYKVTAALHINSNNNQKVKPSDNDGEKGHTNPNTEIDNKLPTTITSIFTEVTALTDQTSDTRIPSGELTSEKDDTNPDTEKDNKQPTSIASISTEVTAVTNQTTDNYIPSNNNDVKEEANIYNEFKYAAAKMDKDYYLTTFRVLLTKCPDQRKRNGISFVVSGLWLHMLLLLLSSEVDSETRAQLDNATYFSKSNEEKYLVIKTMIEGLPPLSEDLKLRWSSHLVLDTEVKISDALIALGQDVLGLKVDFIDGKNTTQLIAILNEMVHKDTHGMLRGSFQDKDLTGSGVRALLLNTIYLRSRWHGAVTLLNGTTDFYHAPDPPYEQTRMFRINDVMGYADLPEWDAEVVDIPYTTPYLSLLVVAPRSVTGIRAVASRVMDAGVDWLVSRLQKRRVAVSLPQYTLRMTVLLPNKLQQMGMPGLIVNLTDDDADGGRLRLSHGMQKIMFWAKAGRHAFKDDGVEWDPRPDLTLVLDRPYIFMVRWHDVILIMGNFVH